MMVIILFVELCVSYADTIWPMYGATLENTHFQLMMGAMKDSCVVKWKFVTGAPVLSYGAAVSDVNGDDTTDIVIGSNDKVVYCLNGVTGGINWQYPTGGLVQSSATIANVDEDDTIEVVIGSCDSAVYCLNGITGLPEWKYKTGNGIVSSPAIADVNGDDTVEVVVGSYDSKVYCLNGVTGLLKWQYETADIITSSSAALVDMDGDSIFEVIIGSHDYQVYCLNGITGEPKWQYLTGGSVASSPGIADVNADDTLEVVIGSDDGIVYCLNGVTGLPKWKYPTGIGIRGSPAIADIDRDDTVEVVINRTNKVYCLNGVTGTMEWTCLVDSYDANRDIAVAELDMDTTALELLVPLYEDWPPYSNTLLCLNGKDGSVLWAKELADNVCNPVIADIDMDGCVEIVVGTYGDNAVWVLDDPDSMSDCGCLGVEESKVNDEIRMTNVEFKVIGNSIYLFTPNAIEIELKVYDICGRLMEVLYHGVLARGGHTFIPNLRSSGIYFVVLTTGWFKDSVKLIKF